MNGIRAARPRVPKVPKVNLGSLWGAKAADLQDDACDLSDGKLSRALCIDHHDPFSSSSTNWVLNGLASNEQQKLEAGERRRLVLEHVAHTDDVRSLRKPRSVGDRRSYRGDGISCPEFRSQKPRFVVILSG